MVRGGGDLENKREGGNYGSMSASVTLMKEEPGFVTTGLCNEEMAMLQLYTVDAHPDHGSVSGVCVFFVSHVAVLRSEQQDLDALHVGASVQQIDGLVQVVLASQRDGQLPRIQVQHINTRTNMCTNTYICKHMKAAQMFDQ